MDFRDFVGHTGALLQKLTGKRWTIDNETMKEINDINAQDVDLNLKEVNHWEVPSGSDFKIPSSLSAYPYITGISDDGTVTLSTIEPKAEARNYAGTDEAKGARLKDFQATVQQINKVAFPDGLDLDNFTVVNVSNAPMDKNNMKYLMENGSVVPLGSRSGVFIPNFAEDMGTFFSMEYEGHFTRNLDGGDSESSFNNYVSKLTEKHFGFDAKGLLSYNMQGDTPGYRAYDDSIYGGQPGSTNREIVFGSAPLSNLVMAVHSTFSAWEKEGLVHPNDKIGSPETGIHISSNVPSLGGSGGIRQASRYLMSAGVLIGALSRTSTRWEARTIHLGVPSSGFDATREDFRLESGHKRLEIRHPATVMDIGYVSNQLVMASKMTTDVETMIRQGTGVGSSRPSEDTQLKGKTNAEAHLFSQLHGTRNTANRRLARGWFGELMDTLGIKGSFEREFVFRMNQKCRGL